MNSLVAVSLWVTLCLVGVHSDNLLAIVNDIVSQDEVQHDAAAHAAKGDSKAKTKTSGSGLDGDVDQANVQMDVVDNQLNQLTDIITKDLKEIFDKPDLTSSDLDSALESLDEAKELRKSMCKQIKSTVKQFKKAVKKDKNS